MTDTPEARLADMIKRSAVVIVAGHPLDDGDSLSAEDRAVLVKALYEVVSWRDWAWRQPPAPLSGIKKSSA